MHNVLVYGSLRKGMGNHRILGDSEFQGYVDVYGYTMVSLGGFPALVPTGTDSSGPVRCEHYEVDEATFERLDMLEGYPQFYDRCMVDQFPFPCWMYFIDDKELLKRTIVKPINGVADWVKFKGAA